MYSKTVLILENIHTNFHTYPAAKQARLQITYSRERGISNAITAGLEVVLVLQSSDWLLCRTALRTAAASAWAWKRYTSTGTCQMVFMAAARERRTHRCLDMFCTFCSASVCGMCCPEGPGRINLPQHRCCCCCCSGGVLSSCCCVVAWSCSRCCNLDHMAERYMSQAARDTTT